LEIPNGLSEAKILEIMEVVVNYLAPSFKFGYFDIDDMKQEGRVFCIECLPDFDITRSSHDDVNRALLNFFKVHVRRRFINLRRNKFERVEPPTCKCDLCISDSPNRLDCHKYDSWVRRNLSKRSLVESFNVDDVYTGENHDKDMDVGESLMSSEIIGVLDTHMPTRCRGDYRRFIENVRLTKERRERIVNQIRTVLSEHYTGEAEEWDFE